MQEKRAVTISAAVVVSVVILVGAVVNRFGLPEFDFGPLSYNANEYRLANTDPDRRDSDGDGLKDWEEELRGTDPEKKDTDEDGTSDYNEIVTGRDPLVAGPYDVVDETKLPLTTRIAGDAIERYMALEVQGQFNEATQEELVTELIDAYTKKPQAKKYLADDLLLVESSEISRALYYQRLVQIFSTFQEIKERETVVLLRVVENDKPSELEKIDQAVEIYTAAVDALAAMPVPSDAAEIHVNFINNLQALATHLGDMRVATSDPLRALIGIATFSDIEGRFIEATTDLGVYLAYYAQQ